MKEMYIKSIQGTLLGLIKMASCCLSIFVLTSIT